jgi:hypothetical protein
VVAVSAGLLSREAAHDNVRLEFPDHPDDIAEGLFPAPEFEGLLGGLGIPEIDGPGEELLGAVDPAGGQELLRPDEADLRALLRADQVLAALAAGDRKIGRPVSSSLRKIRQDRGVFVVRVGADVKDGSQDVQLLEGDFQLPGTGDGGLLRRGLNGEKEYQADDRTDKLLANVASLCLRTAPARGEPARKWAPLITGPARS